MTIAGLTPEEQLFLDAIKELFKQRATALKFCSKHDQSATALIQADKNTFYRIDFGCDTNNQAFDGTISRMREKSPNDIYSSEPFQMRNSLEEKKFLFHTPGRKPPQNTIASLHLNVKDPASFTNACTEMFSFLDTESLRDYTVQKKNPLDKFVHLSNVIISNAEHHRGGVKQ